MEKTPCPCLYYSHLVRGLFSSKDQYLGNLGPRVPKGPSSAPLIVFLFHEPIPHPAPGPLHVLFPPLERSSSSAFLNGPHSIIQVSAQVSPPLLKRYLPAQLSDDQLTQSTQSRAWRQQMLGKLGLNEGVPSEAVS